MSESLIVAKALEQVRDWGNDATLQARVLRLDRQKAALTFGIPVLSLLALGALWVVMRAQVVSLDPRLSGFGAFALLALAGVSHLLGTGHDGGWRYSPMSGWKDSGNWKWTMRSPGARTVYAAILAQCKEACWMHLYLMENVSRAEWDSGVHEDLRAIANHLEAQQRSPLAD